MQRSRTSDVLAARLLARYDGNRRFVRSADVGRDIVLALQHPDVYDARLTPKEREHYAVVLDLLTAQLDLFVDRGERRHGLQHRSP